MRKQEGQISILVVLSLIPLFTLFAFVVNIGMLVNAKISLQNAADLAAYAGAATQARQLTHISHINYQMRQAYKKFLMKYYVIGNMSLRCFPRAQESPYCTSHGGTEPKDGSKFDWTNPGSLKFPGVPAVCISLATESNPCQLGEAVPIVKIPQCFPLDPICGTLKSSTEEIAKIQKKSCEANSLVNQEVLLLWLYATSPSTPLKTQANLEGLVSDLGLVIENGLHFERIKTIWKKYINAKPQRGVTASRANELRREQDQAITERTVLAFNTAFGNLNENVFKEVEMSELMPEQMLELLPIEQDFSVVYTNMVDDGKQCKLEPNQLKVPKVTLGVYKPPAQNGPDVFYAIRLKARAKLLFNPFPFGNPASDVELTAYSAAAPFGSRIGPDPKAMNIKFAEEGTAAGGTKLKYPWLQAGKEQAESMERVEILRSYYKILHSGKENNGNAETLDIRDFKRALSAALVPDQAEIGLYNIPVENEFEASTNKANPAEMVRYYRQNTQRDGAYTFWAPLVSPATGEGVTEISNRIKGIIEENVSNSQTQNSQPSRVSSILIQKLPGYLSDIRANNFNVARMVNPLGYTPPPELPKYKETDVVKIASSYTSDHDVQYFKAGRDGYSVKYIPFRKIASKIGSGFRADISQIDH